MSLAANTDPYAALFAQYQQLANTTVTSGSTTSIPFPGTTTIPSHTHYPQHTFTLPSTWQTGTIQSAPPPPPDPRARPRARVWMGDDEAVPEGPWTVLGEGRDPQTWSRFVVIDAPGLMLINPGWALPVYPSFEDVLRVVRGSIVDTLAGAFA